MWNLIGPGGILNCTLVKHYHTLFIQHAELRTKWTQFGRRRQLIHLLKKVSVCTVVIVSPAVLGGTRLTNVTLGWFKWLIQWRRNFQIKAVLPLARGLHQQRVVSVRPTGTWFNIKMAYQYRKSHFSDKMIVRPFYLHNGNSYTGKTASLYWITPQHMVSSLICAWTNDWASNRCAGDLRRHRAHYDFNVMCWGILSVLNGFSWS